MALSYRVLSSGSSGNCLWVRGGGVEVLVDCGLPVRAVGDGLSEVGSSLDDVAAVLVTHGHGDHVGGVDRLLRATPAEVFATPPTLACVRGDPEESRLIPIESHARFRVGALQISACPTPHDAAGSVSFVITDGETTLGVVTDLGTFGPKLERHLASVDGLVLEFNHDRTLLDEGPYPEHLKRRIRGDLGHLSNEQAARLLARVAHGGLQHLTLAHLSEHNNTPSHARDAAEAALDRAGVRPELVVGTQRRASEPVLLRPRRGRQLQLFG